MTKAFVDTNVIVYSLDDKSPAKREVAQKVLVGIWGRTVISTQVLQELASVLSRKMGLPVDQTRRVVADFAKAEVQSITPGIIDRALTIAELHRIHFWDGLIVAAAVQGRCKVLYTEDLNDGQEIEGMVVRNPFANLESV